MVFSDTGIISIAGIVTRPSYARGDKAVTVTASVYYGGVTDTEVFNLTVIRLAAATDARLSSPAVSGVTLSPVFSPDTTAYSGSAGNETGSITVTPVSSDAAAVVRVNGNVLPGGNTAVLLAIGNNTVTVDVTAQDGTTQKTYTISIHRASAGTDSPTGGSSGSSGSTGSEAAKPAETGVEVLVNGKTETAAVSTTSTVDGKRVTTVTVDDKKVEDRLEAEGNNAVLTIPVKDDADVVTGQLNGQTVKYMQTKEAVLEIKTDKATYTLPASQINIDGISQQIGKQVELKDISVNVKIEEPTQDTVKIVEDTANKNNYQVVIKPIEFEITCASGNRTVDVSRFNAYVERTVAIPDGIDPGKITTGVVLNADGTFSHIPTAVISIEGRYYARINSLTNSTYSFIWNPKTFKDVENHWAKDSINDLGSRLVMSGTEADEFNPDGRITRAEFVATVIKALGLMRSGKGKDIFTDVSGEAWYQNALSTAYEYGLITGYGNGRFGPEDKITREQSMTIIGRAMKITKLNAGLKTGDAEKTLKEFSDSVPVSEWAKESMAECIKTGIAFGEAGKLLAPKAEITGAEAAVLVRRLLQKSGLI
jgi:hypothetical protein